MPLNDSCLTATVITSLPYDDVQDTTTAGTDGPIPSCGENHNTVWYKLVPYTDHTGNVYTTGSNYSTIITVFSGPCDLLTEIACGTTSVEDITLTDGQEYYFRVGSATAGGGTVSVFNLSVTYDLIIDEAQVVPPTGSTATGTGTIAVDVYNYTLEYHIYLSGLIGTELSASINGPAAVGENADVIYELPLGNYKGGTWDFTEEQEEWILNGETYVIIKTTAFPDGEIRGQITGGATGGACCQIGGICTIETAVSCAILGGVYQGDGSTCSTSDYDNMDGITIVDDDVASPYPSTITVSSFPNNISTMTVTIFGLTHSFITDVVILLVGPNGQGCLLMGYVGGGQSVSGIDITFDDTATSYLPCNTTTITSGSYQATFCALGPDNVFPPPAPSAPYSFRLEHFAGIDPNGDWDLYIIDGAPGDSGSITGWQISLNDCPPFGACCEAGLCTNTTDDNCFGNYIGDGTGCTNSLITTFLSNNFGSALGAIYFDINVLMPNGIRITGLDTHTGAVASTAVTLSVYIKSGTAAGFETNIGAWTLTSTGSGTSAGPNFPTFINVTDFSLAAGAYGVALVFTSGAGANHRYTNATISVGNDELTILTQTASNVPFTAPIFSPRAWNGAIYYETSYCFLGSSSSSSSSIGSACSCNCNPPYVRGLNGNIVCCNCRCCPPARCNGQVRLTYTAFCGGICSSSSSSSGVISPYLNVTAGCGDCSQIPLFFTFTISVSGSPASCCGGTWPSGYNETVVMYGGCSAFDIPMIPRYTLSFSGGILTFERRNLGLFCPVILASWQVAIDEDFNCLGANTFTKVFDSGTCTEPLQVTISPYCLDMPSAWSVNISGASGGTANCISGYNGTFSLLFTSSPSLEALNLKVKPIWEGGGIVLPCSSTCTTATMFRFGYLSTEWALEAIGGDPAGNPCQILATWTISALSFDCTGSNVLTLAGGAVGTWPATVTINPGMSFAFGEPILNEIIEQNKTKEVYLSLTSTCFSNNIVVMTYKDDNWFGVLDFYKFYLWNRGDSLELLVEYDGKEIARTSTTYRDNPFYAMMEIYISSKDCGLVTIEITN